jgi:hypothetical protein
MTMRRKGWGTKKERKGKGNLEEEEKKSNRYTGGTGFAGKSQVQIIVSTITGLLTKSLEIYGAIARSTLWQN